jgi:predicted NBD/HSP70 family sugar kinase
LGLLTEKAVKEGYNLIGVGVGVAGTVDPHCGQVYTAPALALQDVDMRELVYSHCQLPTFVDNDVNLAALGEHWRGAGRGHNNVVCISVGTGIGAGLILNRQLYRGSHYFAGEIGFFYLADYLPNEPYGPFGALELTASGATIAKKLKNGPLVAPDSKLSNATLVATSSETPPDLPRDKIMEEAVIQLGIAVANVVSLLDPDVIVLTGGVINSFAEQALCIVTRAVRLVGPPENREQVKIRIGHLGDDAVLVGAAHMVQQAALPQHILEGLPV